MTARAVRPSVRAHVEEELDAVVDVLRNQRGIAVRIGAPQVVYRETLARRVETDTTYKKPAANGYAFARVKMVFEPNAGSTFETTLPESAIPSEFIVGVARGIETARGAGVQAGFPVVDVRVTLADGAWHERDSSPTAFEVAAKTAFREAQGLAGVLLEPIMRLEVTTPEDYIGAIRGDLTGRRGTIESMISQEDGEAAFVAFVPLANLLGYHAQLRALTRGHGRFSMSFSHFAPIEPPEPPRFPQAAALRA